MTLVDERPDVDLIEFTDEDEAIPCMHVECDEEATWFCVWSCGHGHYYCDDHKSKFVFLNKHSQVTCHVSDVDIHILRLEKL